MKTVHLTSYNTEGSNDPLVNLDTVVTTDHAYPTGRLLDGSTDHGYSEEWAEPARLSDGRKCLKMYLFDHDDIVVEGEQLEAENYPWDNEHVKRVKLVD
jgi:hypothetical protein